MEEKSKHIAHNLEHKKKKKKLNMLNIWRSVSVILGILLIISIFTNGFTDFKLSGKTNNETTINDSADKIKLTVINDERCSECGIMESQIIAQLKTLFPNLDVESLDYSKAKKLYEKESLGNLPAFLFGKEIKNAEKFNDIQRFTQDSNDYVILNIGASFNPKAEICDNGIDDTGDGLIDCESSECKSTWKCVEKTDKPKVQLFVMSYCPYGTQMEKGIIPVLETLKDKIDFELEFVDYAMHAEKEVDENLNQYCIQKEEKAKFVSYLRCFLGTNGAEGDSKKCRTEVGISESKLTSCLAETEKEFGVKAAFNDKSTWKGNFASFSINEADNLKYGVQGSPHLVINGAQPNAGRDSASLLKAICFAFKNKPEECNENLSAAAPSPGFGWKTSGNTGSTGSCS